MLLHLYCICSTKESMEKYLERAKIQLRDLFCQLSGVGHNFARDLLLLILLL